MDKEGKSTIVLAEAEWLEYMLKETKMIKLEYKNIIFESDGKIGYYFGWQMRRRWEKVSKEEYDSSSLPILNIE